MAGAVQVVGQAFGPAMTPSGVIRQGAARPAQGFSVGSILPFE